MKDFQLGVSKVKVVSISSKIGRLLSIGLIVAVKIGPLIINKTTLKMDLNDGSDMFDANEQDPDAALERKQKRRRMIVQGDPELR